MESVACYDGVSIKCVDGVAYYLNSKLGSISYFRVDIR